MPPRKRPAAALAESNAQPPHPASEWEPVGLSGRCPGQVRYGSDCSGLDGAACALRRLVPDFKHLFGSEIETNFRHVNEKNHPECEVLYRDMKKRNLDDLQALCESSGSGPLLYTSGFPCQPFSCQGSQLGEKDERGQLICDVLLTISILTPTLAILENVSELATWQKYQKLFSEILLHLTQIGGNMYYVDWKVLDSIDYGVPAARKRVYIVAVRKDHLVQSWNWPAK